MRLTKRNSLAGLAIACGAFALAYFQPGATVAQDAAGKDVPTLLRRNIATQVITLTVEDMRGEPKSTVGSVRFERDVETCWISVVGADVKFRGSTEKQVNRQFFSVDPFPKVVNGKIVEVTGKLGIKDGSGNWDDTYEGTITVAVTAVLANQ